MKCQNKALLISTSPHLEALRSFDEMPDSAFVRQPVVEKLFCCSKATLWRRVKDGGIPAPIKLSERVTGWNVGQLRQAIAKKLGESS